MDTKFENRYYATDKMLSEYIHKVLYKKQNETACFFSVIAGIMLIFSLYRRSYVLSAIFGVCLLLMISIAIFSPILGMRQIKESSERINNGQKYETILKFGDHISISEGTFSLTVEYSQILKIKHLQYSYVLMFGKHNAIIVSPNHFTVGTFEDFDTFIKQKVSTVK